ncbi:DUF4097 family beta strand repeat protein [Maribellus sp. CM-23]|uniref:DUF4097 family beta strand repeat-containing protein n=1 Tax=Maribellus sp. CM-23 TaxID=2781026 RepID=UPI001F19E0E4|nr:DUF4097 family beta strand repeat-containing protein [Maribellus sp. CM-23]MCE4563664.1 DUF4097 family beta strand repeat protein [Maribellus sp. CM-23]
MMRLVGYIMVIACLLPFWGHAQYSETKEIRRAFSVLPATQVEIANKYGKIDIKTWQKDSVVFEIKIRVEEKKQSKLDELLRDIDFDFTASDHYLIVSTKVQQNKSALGKEILKFKETLLNSDGNIQIDYTVWMPNTNRLKVENKFGDVFIGDYKGDVWLNVSNGNLKAYDFFGDLDLTLNFADATINSIQKGRLDCNFSKLYLKKAESVRIQSKSTEFELEEVKDINAQSRRDKFRIQLADLIDAQGSFSTFRVRELSDRINIRADYGGVEVEKIAPDFGNIIIQSKSTDIDLYFERETSFNFEISHTKSTLNLSSEMQVDDEKWSDDGKTSQVVGHNGEKTKGAAKLSITADSGEINIRTQ